MKNASQAAAVAGRDWPETPDRRHPDRKLWVAAACVALLASGIFAYGHRPVDPEPPVRPFQVDASDVNGHVRLTWDPGLSPVRGVTKGTLEVHDGDRSESYPIDTKVLRLGTLDYIRASDDVLLSVKLLDKEPQSQSVIRVIAPVVAEVPPAPAAPPKLTPPPVRPVVPAQKGAKVAKTRKPPPKKRPPTLFVPHY